MRFILFFVKRILQIECTMASNRCITRQKRKTQRARYAVSE